ncbi:MAG: GntR family transcriptional regulator [Anaerolineae bacterium]|nr:GntR family transcriptional regulator [Anaerolineae bacterium]
MAGMIADALRTAISQGRLKSKQPLKQDEIAAEFGVSKIPVREALFQLEAEGLVTFYPNRGAVVSGLSPVEVDEIYAMRIALEKMVLARAIPQLSARELVRAEGVLTAIDHESEPFRWSELNWEFHALLYQPAAMPRVMTTVRTLHVNVSRYFLIYEAMHYQARSQQEHRQILAACRQGDVAGACATLESHLSGSATELIAFLEETGKDNLLTWET